MGTQLSEIKEVADEVGRKFDKFKSEHDARYDAIENEIIAMKRPGSTWGNGFGSSASADQQKSAMKAFVTKGDPTALMDLEGKGMSIGSDPDGGYAVPEYIEQELERLESDASALVRLANSVEAKGPVYKKIVNLGGAAAGWVAETDARPETNSPKLAEVDIQVGELYANPKITQNLLDDIMFDAEAYISDEITEAFSDQLAAALFTGNGTNKPKGVLTYTITTESDAARDFGKLQAVMTEAASAVSFDDLKALKSSLRAKYRNGAAWIMNEATALVVSLIKDQNGNYIWRDAVAEDEPDTLFGYPVEIDENAPDIADDAYPVLFGNFARGYYIARRKGIRLLRDPYTSKPYVNFYTTQRVGGGVVNSECIKLLKVTADG